MSVAVRTSLLLLTPTLLSSAAAGAASQAFCEDYADRALQQRETAIAWSLPGIEGPAWSPSRHAHLLWCLAVPEETANAETAKRQRVLDASIRAPMMEGTFEAYDLVRAPGLVIALRHTRCKNRTTVYGGEPPVGNNQAGPHRLPDPAVFGHPLLTYTCGGDGGAPDGIGYAWNSFPETAGPAVETLGLPAGIVVYLHYRRNSLQPPPAGAARCGPGADGGCRGLTAFHGGDLGSDDFGRHSVNRGFYWHETDGTGFDGDWSVVDRLPKYTVIGLTHSLNQPGKSLQWLAYDRKSLVTYDPTCRHCASPPDFRRVHGGDIGAPRNAGYYWFEKITGAEPADIR